jgi:hypothetical protein
LYEEAALQEHAAGRGVLVLRDEVAPVLREHRAHHLQALVVGGHWPDALNTLLLTEENGKTTATITILYPTKEARDAALQSGMKEGMALSFRRLEVHFEEGRIALQDSRGHPST